MAFSFWRTNLPLVTDPSIKLSQSSLEAKEIAQPRSPQPRGGRGKGCQLQETLRIVLLQKEYLADAISMKFLSFFLLVREQLFGGGWCRQQRFLLIPHLRSEESVEQGLDPSRANWL